MNCASKVRHETFGVQFIFLLLDSLFFIYIFFLFLRINLNFEYSILNLLHNVRKGSTLMAGYEYGYGGNKLKVSGRDGSGYAYVGILVYRLTGSSFVFESGLFGEGVVSRIGRSRMITIRLVCVRSVVIRCLKHK